MTETKRRRGRPVGTNDPAVLPLSEEVLARALREKGWSVWTVAKKSDGTIYAGPTLADIADRALRGGDREHDRS